jgi:hypothetical protein
MGKSHELDGGRPDILALPEERKLRKLYYAGAVLPSPMGGTLEPLRVHYGGSSAGRVMFECLTSSLRYEMNIPKATTAERDAVRKELESNLEPTCPRHGPGERLVRMGRLLACRRCGISFGQPG